MTRVVKSWWIEALKLRLEGYSTVRIGQLLHVTKQRVQQILTPPPHIRGAVLANADRCCQDCKAWLGDRGGQYHISIPEAGRTKPKIKLVCTDCHSDLHPKIKGERVGLDAEVSAIANYYWPVQMCPHYWIVNGSNLNNIATCQLCGIEKDFSKGKE